MYMKNNFQIQTLKGRSHIILVLRYKFLGNFYPPPPPPPPLRNQFYTYSFCVKITLA